jgi:hypothetical protein
MVAMFPGFAASGVALLLCTSGPAAAENLCAPLLKDGLRDYHSVASSSFQYEKVKHWLSSSQASSRSQAESDAQSLGLSVPDVFDVNFGAHNSSTDFQEWKNDFINSDYSEYISNQHNVDIINRVSDTLVAAYATCVNHRSGVQAWIDSSSSTDFQIFFKFVTPEGTNINSVKILGFTVSNATCPGLHQYVGTQLASVRNIQCHKLETETASVSLNTQCCGLEEQPVFRPQGPPPIKGSYQISGTLGAEATKIIQHPLTYTFPATVAAVDFGRLLPVVRWTHVDSRALNKFEDPLPQSWSVAGWTEGPGAVCSMQAWHIDLDSQHNLVTTVSSQCDASRFMFGMGGRAGQIVLGSFLASGQFGYRVSLTVEERLKVGATPKTILVPNTNQSSWKFLYDIDKDNAVKDDTLVWSYLYDLNIAGPDGKPYAIFQLPDGRQQVNSGPFHGVIGADHVLTIFKDPTPGG